MTPAHSTYDFTFLRDGDPSAARSQRRATVMHRTLSFLMLWRQRSGGTNTIEQQYSRDDGTTISIRSASPKHVRVVVADDSGSWHYEFSEAADLVSGVHTNQRGRHTVITDYFDLHDTMARILLTCRNQDEDKRRSRQAR